MPFLSPAKLLVILVVGVIVLGPDKLPGVARQLGAAWHSFRRFRERLESEVRGSFPDLPPTDVITQAVRSPLVFLDGLADKHGNATSASQGVDGPLESEAGPASGTAPGVPSREASRVVHGFPPGVHGDPSMN